MSLSTKGIYLVTLAATLCASAQAISETVLETKLAVVGDFHYDSDTFDAKDFVENRSGIPLSDNEFESLYPIFSGAPSYEVYGLGSLGYTFYDGKVSSDFDSLETYDWKLHVDGAAFIEALVGTVSDPYIELFQFEDNSLSFDLNYKSLSVAEIVYEIGNLTPFSAFGHIASALAPLASGTPSGDFLELIGSDPSLLSVFVDPSSVFTDGVLGFPDGYSDLVLIDSIQVPAGTLGPQISSIEWIDAAALFDITVTASRQVPDSGSSALLALFGLTAILVVRERSKR